MRKALTLGILVSALTTVTRPAEAHIWDFFQELSGPGPFSSNQPMLMGSLCSQNYVTRSALADDAKSCAFFDYRDLRTEANDNFPIEVRVQFWDLGVKRKFAIWKLKESIEGGVAVGLMLASGDEDAGGEKAMRFTVTAPRVVVMPMLLVNELFGNNIFGSRAHENGWLRILKLHLGGTVIVGPLDAEALGVDRTRSNYSRNSEYALSRGFVLDFGELIEVFRSR